MLVYFFCAQEARALVSLHIPVFQEAELNGLVRPTIIVGLFIQQVIALFVLKTGAGYSIFNWIAAAASDLLNCGHAGAQFFFDTETINKQWFFVNVLSSIIFFIALVQMFYYVRRSFDSIAHVIYVTIVARRYAMAHWEVRLVLLQGDERLRR